MEIYVGFVLEPLPTRVLMKDPCPRGSPETWAVAHVSSGYDISHITYGQYYRTGIHVLVANQQHRP